MNLSGKTFHVFNSKILHFRFQLKTYIFFLFFSIGLYGHSQALSVGDVAIIGLNCDPSTSLSKTFAVVALADLSANQVIKFSDKAYYSNAFSTLLGNGSEGIFSWTIPAGGVGKGTVIMFTITSGATPSVTTTPSTGTTSVIEGWTSTTANSTPFGQNGDDILIYQGLESSPTFIFGFNCGNNTTGVTNGWNTGLATNPNGACELPGTLTSGTNAVGFGGPAHVDNFKYNGIQTGTKAAILSEIANTAKWVSDDVTPYDFTPGSGVFTGTQPIFIITANSAQINPSQCGTTIEYLNTQYISAVPVSGAEQYEFKITDGAYTATATDNLQVGKVRLIQFSGYSYNTAYQMSVRAKTGGVWGSFGSPCSITTTTSPHSEIDPAQCGTTLAAMNTAIYTSTVNGATKYRFRIINGANVQTIDRPVRTFDMTMLANYAYGTTYTIDVAVEFDGTWHPYSTACSVTTPSLGSSVVLPSQCGTTLSSVSSSIFSTTVSGATQYRYRVTNGAAVQTIDKSSPSFKLTELAAYSFATTYTVEVAVNYGGTWQAYGTGCNVITPAFPITQVQASQCGAMLASMTTYIYANSVSNAGAYRFRFTEGANVQTYVSSTRAMNVTQLSTHKAFTTYTVEAAAQINGVWGDYGSPCSVTTPSVPAKIQSSQCGATLTRLDKLIYADPIAFATQYRFRVTNGANVQTIDRTTNSFYLTQLGSYAYGTTYTIDVAVQYGGIWQPYSTACTVSSPAAGTVTTGLIASSCGLTLTANSQLLEAEKVVGATQYEFLVENAGLSYSQSIVNAGYTFSMSQLTGLTAATTYTVKVRSKVNNIWSPYGTACSVTAAGTALRQSPEATDQINAFIAYPNPSNGVFTISSATRGTYTILNETGQIVRTIELTESNGNKVEVEGLMNGVYFVTGKVNGEQVTKKMIVVR